MPSLLPHDLCQRRSSLPANELQVQRDTSKNDIETEYLKRYGLPTPVFWPGEFHGLYSPWGRTELDTSERLSLSLSWEPT